MFVPLSAVTYLMYLRKSKCSQLYIPEHPFKPITMNLHIHDYSNVLKC